MYVTLTTEQAAVTTFPQGCPVLYSRPHGDDVAARCASTAREDSLVGAVQSVSIDVSPGAVLSREFLYVLKILGMEGTEMAREASLRYAPRCPVSVRNTATFAAGRGRDEETWWEGSVISSYRVPPSVDDSEGSPEESRKQPDGASSSSWFYSASVVLPGGGEGILHGIEAGSIKFRCPVDSNRDDTLSWRRQLLALDNDGSNDDDEAIRVPQNPSAARRIGSTRGVASAVSSDDDDDSMEGAAGGDGGMSRRLSRRNSGSLVRSSDTASLKDDAAARQSRHSIKGNSALLGGEEEQPRAKRRRASASASEERLDRPLGIGRAGTRGKASTEEASLDGSNMPEIRVIMPKCSIEHKLDIPSWLSTRGVTSHIVGKGGSRHKQLQERTKCKIVLRGKGSGCRIASKDTPTEYLQVVIKDPTGVQRGNFARVVREIEDALIEYVEESPEHHSLGRLLYELEASKEWGQKRNRSVGPVFQRNYKDLANKAWMDVVELPFDSEGNAHGRFLVGPGGTLVSDMRKTYGCDIDIFGVFDKDRLCCDPYVIISSSERADVTEAKKFIIFKIKEHQGKCSRKCALRWQC